MNIKNHPPIFVPPEYRSELERLSKAALMDLVWDMTAPSCTGDADTMSALRTAIDIVLIHRSTGSA